MTDLLTPLQPNAEDLLRPVGTLRGDVAALDAAARRVEVWCGVTLGWRRFGAPVGATSTIVVQWGRASGGRRYDIGETPHGQAQAGRGWDLGAATFPRSADDESDSP